MKLKFLKDGKIISEIGEYSFDFETDLVVCGLGTAGAVCAIKACEAGLNVIGIEKCSSVGGTGTVAFVDSYYYGMPSKSTLSILEKADNDCTFEKAFTHAGEKAIASASKSFYLEKAMCGIKRIFFNSIVIGAFLNDNSVIGVRIFDGKKYINIKSKIAVDNTDGFLSMISGCDINSYRKQTMRCSKTLFTTSNEVFGQWNNIGYIDGLSALKLSKKLLEFETKAPFLKEDYSKIDRIIGEGELVGRREVRTVETEKQISFEDIISFQDYKDTVFYGFAPFDNVNEELETESEMLQNWIYLCYMRHFGVSFAVPMRSLLPKGINGLIVCGKAFGTTHDVASMIRMKAEMEKSGEAAAAIAYLAIKDESETKNVSIEKLHDILIKSGCLEKCEMGIFNLRKDENGNREKVKFPKSKAELMTVLSSSKPQTALLYCFENYSLVKNNLYQFIESDNITLKNNSAIALGMCKDKTCIPILRKIIAENPIITENFNGKHNYGWLEYDRWSDFVKAICLLGRFCDKNSLERIREISRTNYSQDWSSHRINEFAKIALKNIECSK